MALSRDALAQLLIKQIGLNGPEAREMIERYYDQIAGTPAGGAKGEPADLREIAERARALRPPRKPRADSPDEGDPKRDAPLKPRGRTPPRKAKDHA